MLTIKKKIVIDEQNTPIAVLIDYQDWQKIEQQLGDTPKLEPAIADRQKPQFEVSLVFPGQDLPEAHKLEAESKAKEAYIMILLRHGDISTGRAAEILGIPRVDLFARMGEYGISVFPDYTPEELEREVNETARMLEQYKK
jgi:predicted HTH domain antitoxin